MIRLDLRLLPVFFSLSILSACSFGPNLREQALPLPAAPRHVETHAYTLDGENTVLGQLASVPIDEGDTLLDIARHYGLGHRQISAANPGIDVWLPDSGMQAVLPLQFTLPDAPRKGIVVNLAAMRLFHFSGSDRLDTYPVGIGKEGRSTPTGQMKIDRKTDRPTWHVPDSIRRDHQAKGDPLPAVVSPGPDNPLGDYAFYLDRPLYLIHGTNKPYSIGFRASNGCLRLYPEDIEKLYGAVAVRTPVRIVNQPYLIGWLNGEPYLEAHDPFDESDGKRLKKELFGKLKQIEKKRAVQLDWTRIETAIDEAQGLPIPIRMGAPSPDNRLKQATVLARPARWYGQPAKVQPRADGWYVRIDEVEGAREAGRLAALLNHQGPPIPARAVETGDRYQVMTGPFTDAKAAKNAIKRLRVDLELTGHVVEPNARIDLGDAR
jgi:L,D-transpeptidase ErfK/SrfK